MEELLSYILEPGAVVVVLLLLSFFVLAMVRGRRLPQCFSCGSMKVRPSRPDGLFDYLATVFKVRSYRCTCCLQRFYAVPMNSESAHPAPRPHRALAITLRFRHGIPNRMVIRLSASPRT
jgi:hypothetical protein